MTGARELAIELPHLRLSAQAWGDPALPRLLALHGWLDNAATFERLAPLLCGQFHIVAIDLPGHGRSAHRPAGTWYHYIDYVGEALAAADALGWQRFGILGHSLGGAVGCALAAACPERVERLLLIEALGPMASTPEQALTQLQKAIAQRGQLAGKSLRVFPSLDDAARARADAGGLSLEAARVLVARGTRAVDGGLVWSSDPRLTLASPQRLVEAQIRALLGGIRASARLVLCDPPPPFLPAEMVAARAACVPQLEVFRLPGHHHLHLEDPAPVAAALLSGESRIANRE